MSMTIKHTRGPWAALPEEHDKPYLRVRGTRLGERYKVANVLGAGYEGALPCEAYETRANAALITAAPELLAALQVLLERYTGLVNCGDCGNWDPEKESSVIAARHALARAGCAA